jgi:methyl-accepting chemotaxis protein
MIESRTMEKRLDDLEHDNNLLRQRDADRQREYLRMEQAFTAMSDKCQSLIAKVNEFVNRFGRVN